jgi:endoglucanase
MSSSFASTNLKPMRHIACAIEGIRIMQHAKMITSIKTTLVAAACTLPTLAQALPPGNMPYGAFDPGGDYRDETGNVIEHIFLPWEDVALSSLTDADLYALERNRALMITIEPWTWTVDERNTPEFLLNGVLNGYYDGNMRTVCRIIGDMQSPVTVRWAHEMERNDGQFIWAGWEPADYIRAFRRMIDICRAVAPNINIVWSPAGDDGMDRYYPGEEYVDIVGVSIFGYHPWERDILGAPRNYQDILDEVYARASIYDHPVMVAELGYSGPADYVDEWENVVRQPQPDKPLLSAVVYFNQEEVHPWPDGYGYPDWRLAERVFETADNTN